MKSESKDVAETNQDLGSDTEDTDVEDEMVITDEKPQKMAAAATEDDDSTEDDEAEAEDKVEDKETMADEQDAKEARSKKTASRRLTTEDGVKKNTPISGLDKTPAIIPPVVRRMMSSYKNNPETILKIVDFVDQNITQDKSAGTVLEAVTQYFEKLKEEALKEGKAQFNDDYARFIMGILCANKKNEPSFEAGKWKKRLIEDPFSAIIELSRVKFSPRHLFLQIVCEPNAVNGKNFVIPEILTDLFESARGLAIDQNNDVVNLNVDFGNVNRDILGKFVNAIFRDEGIEEDSNEVAWLTVPSCLKHYDPLKIEKRAKRKMEREIKIMTDKRLKEEKQKKKDQKEQEGSKPKKSRMTKPKKSKQAIEEENTEVNTEAIIKNGRLEKVEENNSMDETNETDDVNETKEVEEAEDYNDIFPDQKVKSKKKRKTQKTPKVPKEPKTPKELKTRKESEEPKEPKESKKSKEPKQPKEAEELNHQEISDLDDYDSDDESIPFEETQTFETQKPRVRKQTTPKKCTDANKATKPRSTPVAIDLDDKEEMIRL